MRFLFFRLLIFLLTALRAVIPSMGDDNVAYKRLPVGFSVARQRE